MKRNEAPSLSLTAPDINRGVRWFSGNGCARPVGDSRREVWLGGSLVAAFDETEVALHNIAVVRLSLEDEMHLGQLAEAFELSAERVRQLRRVFERDGMYPLHEPPAFHSA
jgi:hypothetical protein